MNPLIHTEHFRLSAAEANAQQEMSVPLLVTRFIDIATNHANALGFGNPDMKDINGGWVLSRLSFEATRYPAAHEEYSIATWVEDWNRHFSSRCFALKDADGNVIIHGRTIWMVVDLHTHSNLGLSHFHREADTVICKEMECPIPRQNKHVKITSPGIEAPHCLSADTESTYRFKYCDIDYYRHVNTVRYIMLLLNQFSLDLFDKKMVGRFEICFHNEARYGMTVALRRVDCNGESAVTLTDISDPDGNPLLYSRLKFVDR